MSPHDDIAIAAEGVSKKLCTSLRTSMLHGIHDIARNALGLSSNPGTLRRDEFWAVDDLSFSVAAGEVLGIMGANGSGKSTLLKMLSGIFWPDRGQITTRGRVGALIEVGAGFHRLMTGRDNVFLTCAMLGMRRQEIEARFDAIVDFADIGEFIDTPVKMYSSGMYVRLGFSCLVNADLDILLIDEALAVGDMMFQQKCFRRLAEMKQDGTTILIVSHDMHAISAVCDSALLISHGRQVARGHPGEIIDRYIGMTFEQLHRGTRPVSIRTGRSTGHNQQLSERFLIMGTDEITLRAFAVRNAQGEESSHIARGTRFRVVFEVVPARDLVEPHFGVAFFNQRAIQLYAANTHSLRIATEPVRAGETVRVEYELECVLSPGEYTISIGVSNQGVGHGTFQFEEYLLSLQGVARFTVFERTDRDWFSGVFDMKPEVTLHNLGTTPEPAALVEAEPPSGTDGGADAASPAPTARDEEAPEQHG